MVYPNGNGYFNLKNDTVITGDGELFDLVCQETVNNCIEDCDDENMKTYKIIGNIYENKELLNNKE